MSEAQQFVTHVVDLLDCFGPCDARPMFGGFGIFHQGLMFGLIANGSLYLKADDEARALFEAERSEAFTYCKKNKSCQMSYYLAPEAFFEDAAACLYWAHTAFDAALRNPRRSNNKKVR